MLMTEVVETLERLGSESYQRILKNHGATEPVLGVKIADLKQLQKQIKVDYPLALELFDTGIYDAQYLAGLVTDDSKMTKQDLRRWLKKSNCSAISGTTVAWVTAGSKYGWELSRVWIESVTVGTAQAGWMTLSSLVTITPDTELNVSELRGLLQRIGTSIHQQPDPVRYAMNAFVIAAGCCVVELTACSIETAESMGKVVVDMGKTACQVSSAVEYINKVRKRGTIGKKRKSAKC